MPKQKIKVVIYMETQTLTGILELVDGQRLSDFLNDETSTQINSSCRFIQLNEVTIYQADDHEEIRNSVWVNKEGIQMLRTIESNSDEESYANKKLKVYPFVPKLPVKAAIRLSGYEIECDLHRSTNETASNLFEKNRPFMPCTDAKIRQIREDSWGYAGFLLVNRNQMYSSTILSN
jgi:hypothetical protein